MSPAGDGRPLLVAYRALGLGDFLTGVPALRALARAYPHHRRVLCAPSVLAPLAQLLGDAVTEVADTAALAVPGPGLLDADLAVNLHGRGPESHRALLEARPRRLVAFSCPEVGHRGPAWNDEEHEVARWCRLLDAASVPADRSDLDLPVPQWPAPAQAFGATVIHPGAASRARRWPVDSWAAVAAAETAAGRRVVLTGTPDERPLAEAVARGAGLAPECVVAGRTGLTQLAAVVAAAGRVLCADTGVAHMATAFRTPSVVLFGPTPPYLWGPPADRSEHVALWAGRRGDPHADRPDPGLLEITVADVVAAIGRLPSSRPLAA